MKTYEVETRVIDEQPTAAMVATLAVDEIGSWIGPAFATVAAHLARAGAGPAGMPYARFHRVDERTFTVEAGFPAQRAVTGEGAVMASSLPGGEAAITWHRGEYEDMAPAYDAIDRWVADHAAVARGDAWEVYYSDPRTVPDPANWQTQVVQPVTRIGS